MAEDANSLDQVRAWCEQARPLFIVGLARSGTSMLQVAFAQHSAMFDIINCRETHIYVKPDQPFEQPNHRPTALYLKGADNLKAYRQWLRGLPGGKGKLGDADKIRCFFWWAAHHVYPGRQPLEKTPGHVHQLPLIFETFPHAKVVVCSREPLDVFASYRKRLQRSREEGVDEASLRWLEKDGRAMVRVFRRFHEAVVAATPSYGKHLFMAPYEWLVADPRVSLQAVCDFAGMALEPGMLQGSGSSAEGGSGIQQRASDAHKVLTPQEVAMIEEATAPLVALWRKPGPLA